MASPSEPRTGEGAARVAVWTRCPQRACPVRVAPLLPNSRGPLGVSEQILAFLTAWSFDPPMLLGLALAALLYVRGWRILQRRGQKHGGLAPWRAWCFAGGLGSLTLALVSPIDTYGSYFFFMHMIQHLLLLVAAPPLIWLGAPVLPWLWGLPADERRGVARLLSPRGPLHAVFHLLSSPGVAAGLYLGSIAFWHVPVFYDAAQGQTVVHYLEHITFFGTGLLYWWQIVHPAGGRRRLGFGLAVFYLIPPMLEGNLIGALISFAGEPIYRTYQLAPRVWGLTVLEDQQLGGLIMWVPGGMLWIIPIFVALGLFMSAEEKAVRLREAHGG